MHNLHAVLFPSPKVLTRSQFVHQSRTALVGYNFLMHMTLSLIQGRYHEEKLDGGHSYRLQG